MTQEIDTCKSTVDSLNNEYLEGQLTQVEEKRLRELELENSKLKKMISHRQSENEVLKDLLVKKWQSVMIKDLC